MKNVILFSILFSFLVQVQAQINNYDLSVGTTRYYDYCSAYYFDCVASYRSVGIEKVVGDTLIKGVETDLYSSKNLLPLC